MGSKSSGYVLGGIQVALGALISFIPGGAAFGVPLMIAGAATLAGTALLPGIPRTKTLRDSPNYGLDRLENPRGRDAWLQLAFGRPLVNLAVISESVTSIAENSTPGVDAQRRQGFKWLGGLEGPIEDFAEIEVNGRKVFNDLLENVSLGKGTGTKKVFDLPHRWVYLGSDERPDVEVRVDGVLRSHERKSAQQEFLVPAPPPAGSGPGGIPLPPPPMTFTIKRSNRQERILEDTLRVFLRGVGHPEAEQPKRSGTYKWTAQKLNPWRVRIKFAPKPPPKDFTLRVTYDYLGPDGLAVTRDLKGDSKVTFSAAPSNGAKVTATYRTTTIPALRVEMRRGTPDQSPIQGWTDLRQSRNPDATLLEKDQPVTYRTKIEVDDFALVFLAPRGWIQLKDDGGSNPVGARVRVEYRKLGDTQYTTLRSPSGAEFQLMAERTEPVRWEIPLRRSWQDLVDAGDADAADKLDAIERAVYELRVTRVTAVTNDRLVSHELHLQLVTEILHEGFTYPGTALLALSGMPTDFISGGSLRVRAKVVKGKIADPRTDALFGKRDLGSSHNPALILRDLVTSAEGEHKERYGGGSFFTAADILLGEDGFTGISPDLTPAAERDGFIAFADYCDEWVHRPGDDATKPPYSPTFSSVPPYTSSNGERRCRLNLVIDTPQSLMEAVSDVAFLGYCFATLEGARWRFPLDRDGDPVYEFVDDIEPRRQNCSNFRMNLEGYGRTPTHLTGQFWNEDLDFDRDELPVRVAGLAEGTPLNPKDVPLTGCSRRTEAARMLRHLAEQAAAHPYPCSWDSPGGIQFVRAGQIVTVKTRVPYSVGTSALELRVRVMTMVIARTESGKVRNYFTGRVMASKAFAVKPVSMPVSRSAVQTRSLAARQRRVTGLRARVV